MEKELDQLKKNDIQKSEIIALLQKQNLLQGEQVRLLHEDRKADRKRIKSLEEQLAWFKRQVFGQKSERFVDPSPDQLEFAGLGLEEEEAAEPETETIEYTRKKERRQRGTGDTCIEFPDDLPVEVRELDIPESERICPDSGEPMVKIGVETSRKLAHKPGQWFVIEYRRAKYASPEAPLQGVSTAPMPDAAILKSPVDESVFAHVLTGKFADHLPLYRISEILQRDGVRISRQTLSGWVLQLGSLLAPLRDEMRKRILSGEAAFIDESPVKLLEKGKGKCKLAYMWVTAGGGGADPPYRVYDFFDNRRHENLKKIIGGYSGCVHSDQYGAYASAAKDKDEAKKMIWQPCLAHVRRKFNEIPNEKCPVRLAMLRTMRNIFRFERVAWNRDPEERLQIRREKETPLIKAMTALVRDELIKGNHPPRSKLRIALEYYMNAEPHLATYTGIADARPDNNVAERAVRPLALGRKNWLFAGSIDGGDATAVILSLVQTCRGLGVNPRDYLDDILRRIQGHSSHRLAELLPDQWAEARKAGAKQQS